MCNGGILDHVAYVCDCHELMGDVCEQEDIIYHTTRRMYGILPFLNRTSLCSAVSEAWQTLSCLSYNAGYSPCRC